MALNGLRLMPGETIEITNKGITLRIRYHLLREYPDATVTATGPGGVLVWEGSRFDMPDMNTDCIRVHAIQPVGLGEIGATEGTDAS